MTKTPKDRCLNVHCLDCPFTVSGVLGFGSAARTHPVLPDMSLVVLCKDINLL